MHLSIASLLLPLPPVSLSEHFLGELRSVYMHCAMLTVVPSSTIGNIWSTTLLRRMSLFLLLTLCCFNFLTSQLIDHPLSKINYNSLIKDVSYIKWTQFYPWPFQSVVFHPATHIPMDLWGWSFSIYRKTTPFCFSILFCQWSLPPILM